MSNITVAFIAYLLDRIFGDLSFVRHPVILMGDGIKWFEKHFYQPSLFRGLCLLLFMLLVTVTTAFFMVFIFDLLPLAGSLALTALMSAMFLAPKMLHDAVLALTTSTRPKKDLAMLVSRDTAALSESDICKAGIETYAENLSDGVIAPLFYLLLFGLPGIMIYKVVNTLDSMVGYRTDRYERYGKASAKFDDLLNFIPARITALMIMFVSKPSSLFAFYEHGSRHKSPNAGMPISAMALALEIKLGGPTVYFNELVPKVFFGKGREHLKNEDIIKALKIGKKVDFLVILSLFLAIIYNFNA